ncbi:Transposase-like Mu [Ferriphaselus amnicola]|uniref:Transposase-like Mu n=1 Tax=Ferriphaselus amnicola TaxID=1188319 RepID=A0A2Z6GDU7_9PROT|nr:Mu transposase C-terminal domain-containing protein [Ferriphaselus amnicola]BBE51801.1 Transposase-like Mu [Ferriphaselus amnicola]
MKALTITPAATQLPRPALRAEVIRLDKHRKGAFAVAGDKKKIAAYHWESVITAIRAIQGRGSESAAVDLFMRRAENGDLKPSVMDALAAVSVGKRMMPSRSTIFEKLAAYRDHGVDGLVKKHKGRIRIEGRWEGLALEIWSQSTSPEIAPIHRKLMEVHGFTVGYEQVRGYINALPATLGRMSPARIGRNAYRLSQKSFIRRCIDNLLPGDIYVADGYCADIYLAHPITGKLWRPELTVAMDLASRHIVHMRADEHEGTYAVQNMWAECFVKWNHVPLILYVDNGSGYFNHLMSDEMTGFYARSGVQEVIHAIPGNPHGKGWIERFFRTFKDDFLRVRWAAYCCADEQADEVKNHLVNEVKEGRIALPTLAEFMESVTAWLADYHGRAIPNQPALAKQTLWAQLQPVPPTVNLAVLKRRSEMRKVRRSAVVHMGREYSHPDLLAWNGQPVVLEYDLTDDKVAVIRTEAGDFICDAHLVKKVQQFSDNRLEDLRQKRLENQIKRKQKHLEEDIARAGRVFDAEALAEGALPALEGESQRIEGGDFSLDDFN